MTASGQVFPFGNATFEGDLHSTHLAAPIVAAADFGVQGYWLVGADGGVFAMGDAPFYGSEARHSLNARITGMACYCGGGYGYWLVGADGGVFSFGSARFFGSLPGEHVIPNQPIVGISPTYDDGGYWLVGADGGMFAFGDARFFGSLPGIGVIPRAPIVGMLRWSNGYLLAGSDGGVFAFGDAPFYGSEANNRINGPVIGLIGGNTFAPCSGTGC